MEGSAVFSSDGVEVLSRRVQCVSSPEKELKTEGELRSYYELEKCREFVASNGFHRVGKGRQGNRPDMLGIVMQDEPLLMSL